MDRECIDNLDVSRGREQIQDHICSLKIDKATKFLSLPDINKVNNDAVKIQFLKSKGLNEIEINEAFRLLKPTRFKNSTARSFTPKLILNEVANNVDSKRTNTLIPYRTGGTHESSVFVSFCHKLILFAGITSTCYYLYQKWLRWQDERKKKEHNVREELNQIKNDLRKILMDLRQQESAKQNQNELLTEINSIKAILVGRQNFEEKPSAKATLPAWQLANVKEKSPENGEKVTASTSSIDDTRSTTKSQNTKESKTEVPVTVCVMSEDNDPKISSINAIASSEEKMEGKARSSPEKKSESAEKSKTENTEQKN